MYTSKGMVLSLLFHYCLFCGCIQQSNIAPEDFEFLLGEWKMSNAMEGTETTMIWKTDGDTFSATLNTICEDCATHDYITNYSIYQKRGKWYWYNDHTKQTQKPSYHYELKKLEREELGPQWKVGQVSFQGKAKTAHSPTLFQLFWDNKKLLVKYSMLTNGYLFEKMKTE